MAHCLKVRFPMTPMYPPVASGLQTGFIRPWVHPLIQRFVASGSFPYPHSYGVHSLKTPDVPTIRIGFISMQPGLGVPLPALTLIV